MIGVSPAYFLSKFGDEFTISDLIQEIPILKEQGFSAFQVEVTKRKYLKDWDSDRLATLAKVCSEEQIQVSQVVAHFWIDDVSTYEGLQRGLNQSEVEQLLWMVNKLPNCRQLTFPFGRFEPNHTIVCDFKAYSVLIKHLAETLGKLCTLAGHQGTSIALELQPGSIIQGASGFLQMLNIIKGHPSLAYNFDTGHAHATKDVVELIPVRLGQRIVGTHLCDNNGQINLSLTPGEGTILWDSVLSGLKHNQYKGSYDLEIMCKASEVEQKYAQGLRFISSLV